MAPPKMSMSPITFRKGAGKNGGTSKGKNDNGGGILTQMRRRISGHESQLTTKLQLSEVSSENPMFHVKAPSFSSHTGRRDRSTIRRSGRESRVDELLMDEGIDVRDRRSMRRADRKASGRKGTMGTESTSGQLSSKRSDMSSKTSTKRSEKSKKEQKSRTTGRVKASTPAGPERRRSMYEPQSEEMDASEWVTRMAGVMELRKKHRSFRKADFEALPSDIEVKVDHSKR
jgi:hypothetical protein